MGRGGVGGKGEGRGGRGVGGEENLPTNNWLIELLASWKGKTNGRKQMMVREMNG